MTARFLAALSLAVALAMPAAAKDLVEVVIQTSVGDIVVALDRRKAPSTVKNFLRYVDAGKFANGSFYRTVTTKPDNQPGKSVKIDVIQGGLSSEVKSFAPIPLERTSKTGLRHHNGTISMARDKPDSATAEFFICIGPQPELDYGGRRNSDGQGFAAFGQVVSGWSVVDKIHHAPSKAQALTPKILIQNIYRKN